MSLSGSSSRENKVKQTVRDDPFKIAAGIDLSVCTQEEQN